MSCRVSPRDKNRRVGNLTKYSSAALGIVMLSISTLVPVSAANASTHPTYPLANAQHCRTHYAKQAVKKLEHVRVKSDGKWKVEVRKFRILECVYKPPTIVVNGFVNVLDGQLLVDGLAIAFDNLPPIPSVDAIPGDSVSLLGYVAEPNNPTPNGTMTFSVGGSIVPSCIDLPVQNDGVSPPKSEGQCNYRFNNSGPAVVSVSFQGNDGSTASFSKSFTVASPDEVAIIVNECQQLTIGHC
jgi:hypothetical protein